MRHRVTPPVLLAVSLLSMGAAAVAAFQPFMQTLLFDGDFEEVRPGTAPDRSQGAGAWVFNDTVIEPTNTAYSVVGPTDVPVDPTGNALRLDFTGTATVHGVNPLRQRVTATGSQRVRIEFEVLVPEAGRQAGTFLASSLRNRSGVGTLDRGPQIYFDDQGSIYAFVGVPGGSPVRVDLLNGYPIGQWMHMRLDVNLDSDTYDVFYAPRGQPLGQIGAGIGFRGDPLDSIDQLGVSFFTNGGVALGYWDNFSVEVVNLDD